MNLMDKTTDEPVFKEWAWAHSRSKIHNIHFEWSINNFSFRQHESGEMLKSPTFSAYSNKEIKWFLEMYPKGDKKDNKDYLGINLGLDSKPINKSEVFAKFKIYITNSDSVTTNNASNMREAVNFKIAQRWGHPKFIKRSELMNEANGLLPEDILIIFCDISFLYDTNNAISSGQKGPFQVPKISLAVDFGNLLDSQKFSDVTLVVDKHEFPAHRAVLAARSEVFAAMFEHEMAESKSGRVIIKDINHEVLEELLQYIYTGKSPKIKQMASELLTVADKYALNKLKVLCEEALFDELSIETAAETITLAHLYNAVQLKEKTIQYIINHAKVVTKTNGWKTMENNHEDLKTEIFKVFIKRIIK